MKKYTTPAAELILFAEEIVMNSPESENSLFVDDFGNINQG